MAPFQSRALILEALLLVLPVLLLPHRAASELASGNSSGISRSRELLTSCNLFQGKWVADPSYPLYESSGCPFIDPEFDCIRYGRPDKQFLKFSWRPDSCILPRFNGVDFLRRWRGKKIMFVGDSLSLNQWESLACRPGPGPRRGVRLPKAQARKGPQKIFIVVLNLWSLFFIFLLGSTGKGRPKINL